MKAESGDKLKPHVVEAPALVVESSKPQSAPAQVGDLNAAPNTTAAEDATKLGQRHINLIWETTQAAIAVIITGAVIYSEISGKGSVILGNAFTLIVAIYFVRMNHVKTGGVPSDKQER